MFFFIKAFLSGILAFEVYLRKQTAKQIATRFPVNRQDHTIKHPHGYLTSLLKKLLNKKIDMEDPETRKMVRGCVKDAILWRLILNATRGENEAIKEILNRIDGKSVQNIRGEGFGDNKTYVYVVSDTRRRDSNRIQVPATSEPAKD